MGHQQELRCLSSEHGQVAAARFAYLVGTAPSRNRPRGHLACAVGHLLLYERAGAEVSDLLDVLHGKPDREWTTAAGYLAEHSEADRGFTRLDGADSSRELQETIRH